MVSRKTAGIALLVVGIIVLVLSLFADTLGLGGSNSVFGPYQIAGIIIGAIVAVVGLVLVLREQLGGRTNKWQRWKNR